MLRLPRWRRYAGAALALIACCACDGAITPTPPPLALPTYPAPVVVRDAPTVPPSPTVPLPTAADQATVADLLGRWGVGNPGPLPGVPTTTLSLAPGGAWQAQRLSRAPAQTPLAGVQIAPALLLTATVGPAQAVFAVEQGRDSLIPYSVIWTGDDAASVVSFAWQHDGQPVALTPLLLLDAQAQRSGPALFTLVSAPAPLPALSGEALAYLDATADPPRIAIVDRQGRLRVTGPAAHWECDRCWPDAVWSPAGERLAYATSAPLAVAATAPDVRAHLTWRLVVLDAAAGQVLFDQQGSVVEAAQVLGWDAVGALVTIRRPLIPATRIAGPVGQWRDTPYHLRLTPPPVQLVPLTP
ncbi:MAG: hypothetical protein M3Z04_03835 [Chloroflexota bacterium]|nr:hypothetical protein [Chloroflexota bacterium]